MYKIIIVEDKKITREGLKRLVDWDSIGGEIAGCFENGNSAMEYLNENRVDVVLTDIEMDYGNGIDLSEYVHSRYPETKIIMITAFANFEYAKKALELGVYAYVLKPIDENEVLQKVTDAIHEIEKGQKREQLIDNLTRQQVGKYIQEYLDGSEEKHVLLEQYFSQQERLSDCMYTAIAIKSKDRTHISSGECIPLFLQYFKDVYAVRSGGFLYCIVLSGKSERITDETMETIRLALYRKSRICVGETVASVEELPYSVKTSCAAYNVSFLENGRGVIRYSDIRLRHVPKTEPEKYLEFSYLKNLVFQDRIEEYEVYISQVFQTYRRNDADQRYILNQCTEALKYLCGAVNDYLAYKTSVSVEDEELMDAADLAVVERVFTAGVRHMGDFIREKQREAIRPIVKLAFAYSAEHVSDVTLNLKSIAEHLKISYAYLSKAFKEDFGTSYTEYMNLYRIELSKKMLSETDKKVYEICEEIGLEPKNFHFLFKKYEGTTPKEYQAVNHSK